MPMLQQARQQAGAPQQGPPSGVATPAPPGVADPAAAAPSGAEGNGPPTDDSPDVTPQEQAEYERATTAMSKAIYGTNKKTSDVIADGIIAEDKVGSLIQTAVTLIAEVDKQIDMDDLVISDVVEDTVLMLAEVAEEKNGIVFDQDDVEAAQMGTFEGISYIVGGDAPIEPDYQELTAGLNEEDLANVDREYNSRLGKAQQRQEQSQQSVIQNQQARQMGGQPSGQPS